MAETTAPVINVIPPNYRWSAAAAGKAADKHVYLRVGGAKGVTKRALSGAERTSWSKPENAEEYDTIFINEVRITGTPENVQAALTMAGFPLDQIQTLFNGAITRDNYKTTMKAVYDAEIAAHSAIKGGKTKTPVYSTENLLWFFKELPNATIVYKSGEKKTTGGGRGGGRSETLADRIAKLPAGKVLDVSALDVVTGVGATQKNAPKGAGRAGKFGTDRIPIISNDLAKYIRALELAYGADAKTTFAQDIELVRQGIAARNAGAAPIVAPRGASPRAVSPRVPGAVLAAAPVLRAASPPATIGRAAVPTIPLLATVRR